MGIDPEWPLPSESRRIRGLLYLAEGAAIGAWFAVVLLYLSGVALFVYAIGYRVLAVIGGLFVLGVLVVVLVRWEALVERVTHDEPMYDSPSASRDWRETREWRWVAVWGFLLCATSIAISVALWGVGGALYFRAWLPLSGTALAGLGLHRYVFYRLQDSRRSTAG